MKSHRCRVGASVRVLWNDKLQQHLFAALSLFVQCSFRFVSNINKNLSEFSRII